jgi:hypothetical protein
VKVAFKRRGAAFGAPHGTGLAMMDYGRFAMAVSAVGELVLVVEAKSNNPYGGTHLEGVHALYANVATGGAAATLPAASTPTCGMNQAGSNCGWPSCAGSVQIPSGAPYGGEGVPVACVADHDRAVWADGDVGAIDARGRIARAEAFGRAERPARRTHYRAQVLRAVVVGSDRRVHRRPRRTG